MEKRNNIIKDLKIVYYTLAIVSIIVSYGYAIISYRSLYNTNKKYIKTK